MKEKKKVGGGGRRGRRRGVGGDIKKEEEEEEANFVQWVLHRYDRGSWHCGGCLPPGQATGIQNGKTAKGKERVRVVKKGKSG